MASACSEELECGPGTKLVGNKCVAVRAQTTVPPGCVPACAGKTCGDDGCGGLCGTCAEPTPVCDASGACVCAPSCAGKNCGDDGCGGSCGTCSTLQAPVCDTLRGVCVATCVPACSGRECGGDGCGGSCGACDAGSDCHTTGQCVPDAWTCDKDWFGAHDACDCDCGARDEDCDLSGGVVTGCDAFQTCDDSGACVSTIPSAWTCAATVYSEGAECNCACGAPDPDCSNTDLPVYGCVGDAPVCNPDGTCVTCVPSCGVKVCGPDGCGGTCGDGCTDPALSACVDGACESACDPEPILCKTAECGEDGCSGECGQCPVNSTCQGGKCEPDPVPPDPASCAGNCATLAPAGCSCTSSCDTAGTCCSDYTDECFCQPNCTGKNCGSNGCGGSCGTCDNPTPHCGPDQNCTASCTAQCDGKSCGSDGCGGICGTTCADGSVCAWTSRCVPTAWRCGVSAYGDQQGCDCGCGALDPDCNEADPFVIGCPTSETACTAGGLCFVTFCDGNASCGAKWCTGVYYRGGGRYGGTCEFPEAAAAGIGQPCRSHGECATGVCAGARCREYCAQDADCPAGQRCVGLALRDSASLPVKGFVGVCELVGGTAGACASQAGCPGEACTAHVHPVTLAPRYLCTDTSLTIGASCAVGACPEGQLCRLEGSSATCTLPCPGGAADCPGSWHCGSMTFHNAGTPDPADDPTVPVCVRN